MDGLKKQLIDCSNEVLELYSIAQKAEVAAELLKNDYFDEDEDCVKLAYYGQAGVICSIVNDYNGEITAKLSELLDFIEDILHSLQDGLHRGGVVINGFFTCCIQHDIRFN